MSENLHFYISTNLHFYLDIIKSISNPTKMLRVEYQDDDPKVITDKLYGPGKSLTKDFKVENTGDDTGNYSVILDNIENTLERTWDIRYILKNKKTGDVLVKGTLGSKLKKQMVYADISIGVGGLDEYTLELEYENPDEDQSIDMGKQISFKIDIIEAHENIFEDQGEDTLLYAIGRDNPVVNPLTTPGIEVPKFEYTNGAINDDETTKTINNDNYFTYGTSYIFNKQNGRFTINNLETKKLSELIDNVDTKMYVTDLNGKTENNNSSTRLIADIIYEITKVENVEEGKYTITYKTSERETKSLEAILSYTEDNYGTSYYFRGGVENNYITIGNTCWRIVRIQGDGSIKITLYDETHSCENSENNPLGAFITEEGKGTTYNKKAYHTASNNIEALNFDKSIVKTELEKWYVLPNVNLQAYANQIEQEAEWCNDMSTATFDLGNRVGTYFGSYDRLFVIKMTGPSLRCPATDSTELDSSKYIGKIALLTADETGFAGSTMFQGKYPTYYLQRHETISDLAWHTMTPFSITAFGNILAISGNGRLFTPGISSAQYIRPAIVLTASATISGDGKGTKDSPYILSNGQN